MNHPLLKGQGPIYRRLAAGLQAAIQAGQYQPGQRLPSTRWLQKSLELSLNTIHQSLRLLEGDGWVEIRPQAGCYVLARQEPVVMTQSLPIPVLRPDLTLRLLSEMNEGGLSRLGGSQPNPELLPTRQIRRLFGRLSRQDFPNRYDLPGGCPELRRQIARLSLGAGITVEPERVLLTSGCQEAIMACLQLLCREGDTVAVESPTFYGYLEVLEILRLRALEIPSSPQEGLSVPALAQALEQHPVRCLLVTPNFSNPQAALMSEANKRELVKLPIPIIENDIQGDLFYSGNRPLALRAFRDDIFYCSSFSKVLGPEFRVGWVLSGRDQGLLERSLTFRSFGSNGLTRLALAEYLAEGDYLRVLRQARQNYARQARNVHHLLCQNLPAGSRVHRPEGGKMLWIQLPGRLDALHLYQRCRARGISLSPGQIYATDDRYRNFLRLNCSYWNTEVQASLQELCRLAQT